MCGGFLPVASRPASCVHWWDGWCGSLNLSHPMAWSRWSGWCSPRCWSRRWSRDGECVDWYRVRLSRGGLLSRPQNRLSAGAATGANLRGVAPVAGEAFPGNRGSSCNCERQPPEQPASQILPAEVVQVVAARAGVQAFQLTAQQCWHVIVGFGSYKEETYGRTDGDRDEPGDFNSS